MVIVRRTRGSSYLCCELNGAMLHGKIAQFRVVPYIVRKKIRLSEKIEELIDVAKDKLDELADAGDEEDEYLGKDMQFHKIRLNPDWEDVPADELSEEYESDEELEVMEEEEIPVYDEENPRRGKRVRKQAQHP